MKKEKLRTSYDALDHTLHIPRLSYKSLLTLLFLLLPVRGRTTYEDYVKGYNKGWAWGWKRCLGKKSVPMNPPYPEYPQIYGRSNRFDGFIDGAGDGYDAASKFTKTK